MTLTNFQKLKEDTTNTATAQPQEADDGADAGDQGAEKQE